MRLFARFSVTIVVLIHEMFELGIEANFLHNGKSFNAPVVQSRKAGNVRLDDFCAKPIY